MSDAKRLRALEDENNRLKRMLADEMLDNAAPKDFAKKQLAPDAKRRAVRDVMDRHSWSERRALEVMRWPAPHPAATLSPQTPNKEQVHADETPDDTQVRSRISHPIGPPIPRQVFLFPAARPAPTETVAWISFLELSRSTNPRIAP